MIQHMAVPTEICFIQTARRISKSIMATREKMF